jgi:hypothetical protein
MVCIDAAVFTAVIFFQVSVDECLNPQLVAKLLWQGN